MSNDLTSAAATDLLQQLLAQQAALTIEQRRANDLQEQELRQNQQGLDLQATDLALKRETLNRAESRLNEIVQRWNIAESKLITTDDAFAETIQRILVAMRQVVSAEIDNEKAIYALLSQNSQDIREARLASPDRLQKLRTQELILQHQETLHALQLQAAAHGSLEVPIRLQKQIENEKRVIEELEEKL